MQDENFVIDRTEDEPQDLFDGWHSLPEVGAVERDWTQETLTVDITNSLDEKFHFEISPKDNGNAFKMSAPRTGGDAVKSPIVIVRAPWRWGSPEPQP